MSNHDLSVAKNFSGGQEALNECGLIIVPYYGLAPLTAAVEVDKEGERTKLRSKTRRIVPPLRRRGN
jgi:hypothetical protein